MNKFSVRIIVPAIKGVVWHLYNGEGTYIGSAPTSWKEALNPNRLFASQQLLVEED